MRAMMCFVMTLPLMIGCGGGDFPTATVTGRVVCDGQPVPGIHVFFEPLSSGENSMPGKQGLGRTEDDGTFEISTYGRSDGAVVGKHRVRVGWSDGADRSKCPCEVDSEKDLMEVEVKKGETNDFELVLAKATGKRRRPTLDELEEMEEEEDER